MLGEPRDLLRQRGRIIDLVCPAGAAGGDSDLLGTWGSFESPWRGFAVGKPEVLGFPRAPPAPRLSGDAPQVGDSTQGLGTRPRVRDGGFLAPGDVTWGPFLGPGSLWGWGRCLRAGVGVLGWGRGAGDVSWVKGQCLRPEDSVSGEPWTGGWCPLLGTMAWTWGHGLAWDTASWVKGRGLGAGGDTCAWGTVSWVGGQ